ncbi:MAG: radical SAM protein [bacterium]
MPEINEIKIQRILNPTAIDLGEYVINPFMGCEYACLYCYVRSNRVISKKNKPWGEYVDVRVNAPELLEKELKSKNPKTVLLGSTTECFQPAEAGYGITKRLIEILNNHGVYYVILTRSPYIVNYIDLLKKGFCKRIYFTVNNFGQNFKNKLEPNSPPFNLRIEAVNSLLDENITVVPYFSPVLPWISDFGEIFPVIKHFKSMEFECLNFNLKNIDVIIKNIGEIDTSIMEQYKKMIESKMFYDKVWFDIKNKIVGYAKSSGADFNVHVHNFGGYFENKYKNI